MSTMVTGRARPESGIELAAWIFMRVSGVVLLVLVLLHLAIMHMINNVEVISYHFVAVRYATPFWRTYDLVMLWLAMVHGLNGLRVIVDDYVLNRGWRVIAMGVVFIAGVIFLALGSIAILTFHPVPGA